MNSKEVLTIGVAREVELQIGEWLKKEPIEVVSLDNFDLILGIGSMDHNKVLLFPSDDGFCIMDPACPRVVPVP